MRHLYDVTTIEGNKIRAEGKKDLEKYLKNNVIVKVEWYVSNGHWNDVTSKYVK